MSVVLIGGLVFLTVGLVGRIPGGFVPEEDQGYILVNASLPDASSLERTDAVMRKVEKILAENEGVEGYNTISGFSLITGAYSSNMGFFFVQLKEWEERNTAETARQRRRRRAEQGVREGDSRGASSWRSARRPSRASAPAPGSRWSCRTASATRRE